MMFGNNTDPTGRIDREVKDMLLDMLGTELANDPNASPDSRASVGVILEAKRFERKLKAFVISSSKSVICNDDPKLVQKVNDIIEYIRLMSAGLDSFMEAWKNE